MSIRDVGICALAAGVAALGMAGCSRSSVTSPTPLTPIYGTVSYAVDGTAQHVLITYRDSAGHLVQTNAAAPFFYQWMTATAGEPLFISAQIDTEGDAGGITVLILKNGAEVQEVKATAYPNAATASATY